MKSKFTKQVLLILASLSIGVITAMLIKVLPIPLKIILMGGAFFGINEIIKSFKKV